MPICWCFAPVLRLRGLYATQPYDPYSYAGVRMGCFTVLLSLPTGWTSSWRQWLQKSLRLLSCHGRAASTIGSVGPYGLFSYYCRQDGDRPPAALLDFAAAWDRDAVRLRTCALGIGDDWAWRFGELSSGQQKRLELAVALWSH